MFKNSRTMKSFYSQSKYQHRYKKVVINLFWDHTYCCLFIVEKLQNSLKFNKFDQSFKCNFKYNTILPPSTTFDQLLHLLSTFHTTFISFVSFYHLSPLFITFYYLLYYFDQLLLPSTNFYQLFKQSDQL